MRTRWQILIRFRFNEKKATQAAAKLIAKRGGNLDVIVLLKLLYLVDREALARWGRPVTGDTYYSLKNGPVLSTVYDLTKGEPRGEFWPEHIVKDGHTLRVETLPGEDELSENETDLLCEISEKWEGVDKWTLRDFSHTLGEYQHLKAGRELISIEDILSALGKSAAEVRQIELDAMELEKVKQLFGA